MQTDWQIPIRVDSDNLYHGLNHHRDRQITALVLNRWVILAVAAILRLVGLGSESLWYDEGFTAYIAKLPDWLQVIRATLGDVHPPLWYTIEYLNIRIFGNSEFALRLPSALIGVGVVALIMHYCRVAGLPTRVGGWVGWLVAVLPGFLYYSQESRPYVLLVAGVLIMLIAGRESRFRLFVLGGVITAYSQNLGLLYVVAAGSILLLQGNRWVIRAGLVIGCIWLPWLPGLLLQVGNIARGFWITPIDIGAMLAPIPQLTIGWRVADLLLIVLYPLAFALSFAGLWVGRGWIKSRPGLLTLGVMLIPPGVAGVVSLIWRSVYVGRAFLPSIVLLMIFWALLLTDPDRKLRLLAAIALIPALLLGDVSHYFPSNGGRQNIRELVGVIDRDWLPGDVIYFPGIAETILSSYYIKHPYFMDPSAGDLNQMLSDQSKIDFKIPMAPWGLLAATHPRIWIVVNDNMGTSQKTLDWLQGVANHLQRIKRYANSEFVSVTVYLWSQHENPTN